MYANTVLEPDARSSTVFHCRMIVIACAVVAPLLLTSAIDAQETRLDALISALASPTGTPTLPNNIDNETRRALLTYLIERNMSAELERALALDFDPNLPLAGGIPPLHYAVPIGDTTLVRALLAAGAARSAIYRGSTAYDLAFALKAWDVALTLAPEDQARTDVQMRSAIANGELAALDRMHMLDADFNKIGPDGMTPLTLAVRSGRVPIVERLLAHGADANLAPENGVPPVLDAILSGEMEILERLLTSGADPNLAYRGRPLLQIALLAAPNAVARLVAAGADPGATNDEGVTAKEIAQVLGQEELVALLGLPKRNLEQMPDLLTIIRLGGPAELTAAIKAGADPDRRVLGDVPLVVAAAAEAADPATFAALLAVADPRATDPQGLGVIDGLLAREDWPVYFDALVAATTPAEIGALLSAVDDSGRSGAVKIAATHVPENSARFLSETAQRVLASVAHRPDNIGLTPVQAAVVMNNAAFLSALREVMSVDDFIGSYEPSLNVLARQSQSWDAFLSLPYDRVLPESAFAGLAVGDRASLRSGLVELGQLEPSASTEIDFGHALVSHAQRVLQDIEALAATIPDREWVRDWGHQKLTVEGAPHIARRLVFSPDNGICKWVFDDFSKEYAWDHVALCYSGSGWEQIALAIWSNENGQIQVHLPPPGAELSDAPIILGIAAAPVADTEPVDKPEPQRLRITMTDVVGWCDLIDNLRVALLDGNYNLPVGDIRCSASSRECTIFTEALGRDPWDVYADIVLNTRTCGYQHQTNSGHPFGNRNIAETVTYLQSFPPNRYGDHFQDFYIGSQRFQVTLNNKRETIYLSFDD